MKDKDIISQINDIIEGEIQNNINEYLEDKEEKEKEQGMGFADKDNGKELKVNISKSEVERIMKEYKKIKKNEKSNLNQVKKLGLVDKNGVPWKKSV